jgi:hypothetical protein
MIKTCFISLSVVYPLGDASADALRLASISWSLKADGLKEIIASWAFLSFAADTIFMALVICCVDFTEPIRIRTSFKLAILF